MYVIADIEWVTTGPIGVSPVQIGAVRVDENWNCVNTYFSFIKPLDSTFKKWKHIACTGGTKDDFLNAASVKEVFSDFIKWLNGDTLLWWLDDSKKLFNKLVSVMLGSREVPAAISINEYVHDFLKGQFDLHASAYKIAEARGIDVQNNRKHCSDNDVRVIYMLMKAIDFPQEKIQKPALLPALQKNDQTLRYTYDQSRDTIHLNDCDLISGSSLIRYPNFTTAIKKEYHICKCCRKDYLAALREKNKDTLSRISFNYVFSPDSKVFHKPSCYAMQSVKSIRGTGDYTTALKSGRRPCKLCNPSPTREYGKGNQCSLSKSKTAAATRSNQKEINKAIAYQNHLLKERKRMLRDNTLSAAKKRDIITLTQPGYAFWSGQGYRNFHLRSCPKLNEMSNLCGYRTFQEAVKSGHTPCKKCKPTAKHDTVISFQTAGRKRNEESISDIEKLCQENGLTYKRDEKYLHLRTPVGKWKIDLNSNPVKLLHINLRHDAGCEEYHVQPRKFLSLTDAVLYIKRHDEIIDG